MNTSTASQVDQKRLDFVQSILGRYGITRWRSRFQNLILRQFPLLFPEPEAVKPEGAVINQVNLIQHTHIHQSIIHPLTRVMMQPGSPNQMLQIRTGSNETVIGNSDSLQEYQGGRTDDFHAQNSNLNLIHVLQERVGKQNSSDKHPVTRGYRTFQQADTEPEPISPQNDQNQKRTAETRPLHLLPVPESPAGGTEQVEQDQRNRLVPHVRKSRLHDFFTNDEPQPLRTVHHQLHTLRTYTLSTGVAPLNIERPMTLRRELPANRDVQTGQPPGFVLRNSRKVVSSSGGTAVDVQHNSSPLIFMPSQDFLPSASPGLHLGLGPGVAAVLEKMESKLPSRNPLLQESASLHNLRQSLAVQPIQLLTAPSESQREVQRQGSLLLGSTTRRADATVLPAEDPMPGLIHMAEEPAAPSAQRRSGRGSRPFTVAPGQEEEQQAAGRHSSLVLRKSEAPKAAGQEPVQQLQEAMLQEQAVQQLKAQPSPRAAVPAAKMDAAELNQLAERVYQVLEKKMAIRKDRRGLR
ncbi:hypothetical protein [Paenibacillus sp. sgz5001063]|uniref:hypothetical protein n=1 Tax=Paenibacillus sp. sgz5001063 TaxID=3242474 RepID=UPI0036D394A3